MAQALRFTYVPGSPRPDATKNSPRAIMLWERGKKEYEEYEFRKKLEAERFANREPATISEFDQVERDNVARAQQRAAIEAEEDRIYAQQQKEERERQARQASEKDQQYIRYWNATTAPERTAALIAYAMAIGTADGYSGSGFASQAAVDKTLASLNNINNAPSGFRSRLKEIKNGPVEDPEDEKKISLIYELSRIIDGWSPEDRAKHMKDPVMATEVRNILAERARLEKLAPVQSHQERMNNARQQLLGL